MISFTQNNVYKDARYLGTIIKEFGEYRFYPVAGAILSSKDLGNIANRLTRLNKKKS